VLAAAVLWGTTGTAQALAPPGAEPASVGGVRILIGGATLLALAVMRGRLHRPGNWPSFATALTAASVALYQVCFFAGVVRSGVALGTIVTIGSAPVFAGLFGWLARRARPEPGWSLATALSVAGAALLLLPRHERDVDPLGVALNLGAGAAYATFALASKAAMDAGRPPIAVMGVAFSGGALLLSPVVAMSDLSWLVQLRGLAVAFHLGVVATALAYVLFGRGLQGTPVTTAATLSLAEPLTAASLGVLLLQERLTVPSVLGAGLLLAGLVLLARWPERGGRATTQPRTRGTSSTR
jgi:DME family drug/metabolite transporter